MIKFIKIYFDSRRAFLLGLIPIIFFALHAIGYGQENDLPHFFNNKIKSSKPDLSGYERIRFLTIIDFPPFNYLNREGRAAGYNIDLIRALCEDLDIVARCQIEVLPFNELQERLLKKGGEVIIAGLAPNVDNRQFLRFSGSYIVFPARFIGLDSLVVKKQLHEYLEGVKVGVVAHTNHEVMLRSYFPQADISVYQDYDALYAAVLTRQISLAFGDGLRFSLWLSKPDNGAKIQFWGGAYVNKDLLGAGMKLAVRSEDENLMNAFDYSLNRLEQKGKLQELYLRYFPIGFF